jgi:hypothetical protein
MKPPGSTGMTAMRWVLEARDIRRAILRRMKQYKITTTELAVLSNVTLSTVVNFLEERTYSPHGRTLSAMLGGVGYVRPIVQTDTGQNRKSAGGS